MGWKGFVPEPGSYVTSATVISDIHGIAPALRAVLEEESRDPSDVLIVAGDTAAGPQPNQVIEILQEHSDRLVIISGNGDREMVEIFDGKNGTGLPDIFSWAAKEITAENVEWLRALPGTATLDVVPFGSVHVCHATPQNDMDIVLVDSRLVRWSEVFVDLHETIQMVILGHTHMPFQRLVAGRRVINPGSVGMPYGKSGAQWTRLTRGVIETRVTNYDFSAALDELESTSSFPGVREWAKPYLTGAVSDVEVIEQYGPKDGRSG